MIALVTDVDAFAVEQGEVQRREENSLYGSALYALRRFGQKGWADALISRAERLIRKEYHKHTGQWTTASLREQIARWSEDVYQTLRKTTKPTPESIKAQASALASLLATSALNTAMEEAGTFDERAVEKMWVSREDERVRPAHAAAHGQRVSLGEKFTVGGFEMSRPGDLSAPIHLTVNCRCLLALVPAEALAASAEEPRNAALIVFLPAEDDPVNDISSEDAAHVTTVWFGKDNPALSVDAVKSDVEKVAKTIPPFTVKVAERGELGDERADVLFLDGDGIAHQRDALLTSQPIVDAMNAVEQYPNWTPHLTLGYPENPALEGDVPTDITIDRLALWVGQTRYTYTLGEGMNENVEATQDAEEPTVPAPEDRLDCADEPIPFWGVLAPEGSESGDQRMFEPGSLRVRPLPIPLSFQKTNEPGHDGSFKVGNIKQVWRRDDLVYGAGHFLSSSPDVDEVIGMMVESDGRMGVSVDADDGEMEMRLRSGQTVEFDVGAENAPDPYEVVTVFTTARIAGATGCHIPAFHEAFIALGDIPEDLLPAEGEGLAVASRSDESVAASAEFAPGTQDGPGWLTHPVETDRLRDYWTHGKGAAKIGWGMPGDFNRCRAHLAKYIKPNFLSSYCANRHKDALGFWPGQHRGRHAVETVGEMASSVNLVAAGDPWKPPSAWFSDPGLLGPSPLVVTEDGHVFGHLATWGSCHIGFKDVCTTPPASASDYAYFRTGSVLTDDGKHVAVGQITMGTGHAALSLSARPAAAHYDDTGTAVADVAAGDDEHGIWVSGAIRPSATPEQIAVLRASALSGDWRTIGGNLELVAALSVNVPGFPIPRTALAASGGEQTSLIAANIVDVQGHLVAAGDLEDIVGKAVADHLAARDRKAAMEEMARATGRDPKTRMAALAASREGN